MNPFRETETLSVRVTEDAKKTIKAIALGLDTTIQDLVSEVIYDWLIEYKKKHSVAKG